MRKSTQDTGQVTASNRYAVTVDRRKGSTITVIDRERDARLFGWSGRIASHLLDSGAVRVPRGESRTCYVDKSFARHLSLVAAAAGLATSLLPPDEDRENTQAPDGLRWCRLRRRERSLCISLRGHDRMLAKLLYARPGEHFSTADLSSLLALQGSAIRRESLDASLERLANQGFVQRIDVAPGLSFYDIDTRPHLHIFDESSGELRDAEVTGVLRLESADRAVTVDLFEGPRVRVPGSAGA